MQKSLRASVMLCGSLVLLCLTFTVRPSMAAQKKKIRIGVILDLNSTLGSMANNSIALGIKDFFNESEVEVELQIRDSQNDVGTAASAASDLIENEKVHVILGPQNSEQAWGVVKHGEKAQVPVIWFPLTGPTLLPPPSLSSIHSNQRPCFQFKAIEAVVEALGWQSIIPIYEDTEYGSELPLCLMSGDLKELNKRVHNATVIYPNAIFSKLHELNKMQTHVFLVHMTVDFGSTFIMSAQRHGMMNEGYAWILTQGLSNSIDPDVNNITLKGFMQGALGVRPMVPNKAYKYLVLSYAIWYSNTVNLYGFWAYDTIEALAKAVELQKQEDYDGKLGDAIRASDDFQGVSGIFSFKQRQLQPSVIEVYNVIGQRERIIGHWSPGTGLVQNYSDVGDDPNQKYNLKEPMWPGDTMDKPPKWKIGVPSSNFSELVNIEWPCGYCRPQTSGLAFNVFSKVLDLLPFPLYYEFVPLTSNGTEVTAETYDDLLCQMNDQKKVDAIIGDITIVANRTRCVDFTLPYLDTSVSIVVKVRRVSTSKRILLEPFHWSLWFLLGGIFVGATIIAIILESHAHSKKKDNQAVQNSGTDENIRGDQLIYIPFLIYKIDIKQDLDSKTARWMVILTSFLFVMVVQVYTANLTSILTEAKSPKPSFEDVEELKTKNLSVGYQRDSWVRGLLIEQMRFDARQLKPYGTRDEYYEALSNGTEKGGVDAIFDETPYLMLFLSKYNSYFMMAGPIYKTGGFGFAFPKNSILVPIFSKAILSVTQDIETFRVLRTKSSLPTTIDEEEYSEYQNDLETPSLSIADIGGLFPIALYVLTLLLGLVIVKFFPLISGLPCWPKMNRRSTVV